MTTENKWYKIYKSNGSGDRKVVDEVRGEDRAVHRVDILNDNRPSDEREHGWSYYRANKGTSAPALEHSAPPRRQLRPDTRRKRRS